MLTLCKQAVLPHQAAANTMFLSNVPAVERTLLVMPSFGLTSPLQMNARRDAACYMPLRRYRSIFPFRSRFLQVKRIVEQSLSIMFSFDASQVSVNLPFEYLRLLL